MKITFVQAMLAWAGLCVSVAWAVTRLFRFTDQDDDDCLDCELTEEFLDARYGPLIDRSAPKRAKHWVSVYGRRWKRG